MRAPWRSWRAGETAGFKPEIAKWLIDQEHTLRRLEAFLGIPLARIPVRDDSIGRWTTDDDRHDFDFFGPAMREPASAA